MVKRLAALPALVTLLAGATCGAAAAAPAPAPFIPLLEAGDGVPPIPLIAQDGHTFSLADFHGQALLVSFIYTRCADARMCPLVSAKFSTLQHALGSAPIHLVCITLDPRFDTAAVLRRYGRAFGQDARRWTLATSSTARVYELASRLGIATATTAPGRIVHAEAAIVIAPDGRIARTIDGNAWSASDLLAAAQATLPGGNGGFIGIRTWLAAAVERCGGGGVALSGAAMLGIFGVLFASLGGAIGRAFR